MDKRKGKIMKKNYVVSILGVFSFIGIASVANAQANGYVQPTNVNQQSVNNQPVEKIVIEGNTVPVNLQAKQAANPMGSIEVNAAGISYGGNSSLDNQGFVNVDKNSVRDGSVNYQQYGNSGGIPAPYALPAGLPNNVNNTIIRQEVDQLNPLEKTMNILNSDSERIRDINRQLYEKGRVLNSSPVDQPEPANSMLVANLSPGSTAPVIRLSRGRTSAIAITDSAGNPWPIVNLDGLPEQDFSVKRLDAPAPEGSVISVTPLGQFVSGNLVMVLKGLSTPVVLEFVSAQPKVDVKSEIRVQALGPNASVQSIRLPRSADNSLLSVLQGVPPEGATVLDVNSNAVQAWLSNGYMFVRTRYRISSPAPLEIQSSLDGTFAYKMYPTPEVAYSIGVGKRGSFFVSGF